MTRWYKTSDLTIDVDKLSGSRITGVGTHKVHIDLVVDGCIVPVRVSYTEEQLAYIKEASGELPKMKASHPGKYEPMRRRWWVEGTLDYQKRLAVWNKCYEEYCALLADYEKERIVYFQRLKDAQVKVSQEQYEWFLDELNKRDAGTWVVTSETI